MVPQPFCGAPAVKAIRVPCSPSHDGSAAVPGPPSSARRFTIGPSGESAGVSGVTSTPESTRHTAAGFAGGSRYGTKSKWYAFAWAVGHADSSAEATGAAQQETAAATIAATHTRARTVPCQGFTFSLSALFAGCLGFLGPFGTEKAPAALQSDGRWP